MAFIANAISDVFDFVIGVVEDVAEFVVEEIIQPVVKVVGDVVEAVINDPIATIASIAAAATGNAWAIPLINGADTLAKGGNFGDVLKSVAVGYAAPKIGSYVTGAVTGATGSVVAGNIAGSAVEAGARGGDLRSALLGGVSSEIASAATKTIKTNLPSGNFGQFEFNANTETALNKGIKAYIDSGGDISEAAMIATTATVTGFIKDNSNFNGDITDGLVNATVAGLGGGDALGAFNSTLNAAGLKDLNAKIDNLVQPIKKSKYFDVNGGEHSSADGANTANKEALDGYNTASANYKAAVKANKYWRGVSIGRGDGGLYKQKQAGIKNAKASMNNATAAMNNYKAAVTNRVDLDLDAEDKKFREAETARLNVEAENAAADARIIALAKATEDANRFISDYDAATDAAVEEATRLEEVRVAEEKVKADKLIADAEEAERVRLAEEAETARLNKIADDKLIEDARIAKAEADAEVARIAKIESDIRIAEEKAAVAKTIKEAEEAEAERVRLIEEARVAEEAVEAEEVRVAKEAETARLEEVRLAEVAEAKRKSDAAKIIADAEAASAASLTAEEEMATTDVSDASEFESVETGEATTEAADVTTDTDTDAGEFTGTDSVENAELETLLSNYEGTEAGDFTEGADAATGNTYLDEIETRSDLLGQPSGVDVPDMIGTNAPNINEDAANAVALASMTPKQREVLLATQVSELMRVGISHAKDLGYNISSGFLEEAALSAAGLGKNADEFIEFIDGHDDFLAGGWTADDNAYGLTDEDMASISDNVMSKYPKGAGIGPDATNLDAISAAELANEDYKSVLDGTDTLNPAYVQRTFGTETMEGFSKYLNDWSKSQENKISDEMRVRQYYALPADDMTIEQIMNGTALDKAGRPYGSDKIATAMTGAQEVGDIGLDLVLMSIPFVGLPLAYGISQAAASEAARQDIARAFDTALKNGTLENDPGYQSLLKLYNGDENQALDRLKDRAEKYAFAAGNVGAVADLAVAKMAAASGVKSVVSSISPKFAKLIGFSSAVVTNTGIEGVGEGIETYLANKATEYLGTDPMEGVAGAVLLGAAGGTAGTTAAGATLTPGSKLYELVTKGAGNTLFTGDTFLDNEGNFSTSPEGTSEYVGSAFVPNFANEFEDAKSFSEYTEFEAASGEADEFVGTGTGDTFADLESTGEISSNLSPSVIADLESTGEIPADITEEETVVEDAFADLESTGEIPAGIDVEDAFADLESTGEIPAGITDTVTTGGTGTDTTVVTNTGEVVTGANLGTTGTETTVVTNDGEVVTGTETTTKPTDTVDGSEIDIFGEGEVDPRIPDFGGTDTVDDSEIDKFGEGEVDPRIPDFDGTDTVDDTTTTPYTDTTGGTGTGTVTVDDVVNILGGDPDTITDADIDVVAEITAIIEAEIDADTDIDTDIDTTTAIDTTVTIPNEDEAQRRKQQEEQGIATRTITSESPDLMNLQYLYDIGGDSIFATPEQQQRFDTASELYERPYEKQDIQDIQAVEDTAVEDTVSEDTLLQLLESSQNEEEAGNVINLFGDKTVDEKEKKSITSPYAEEDEDSVTRELYRLFGKAAFAGGLIQGNGDS